MRLVPSDPSHLEELFEVFCDCAELNPDPVEEGEEEHNWIYRADQMMNEDEDPDWFVSENPISTIGQSNGDNGLAHNILQLQINDQRFEDAEEPDDDVESAHH